MYPKFVVVANVLLSGALAHHAAADCPALSMREPKDADFERCLKSRPLLTLGAVGSLTLGGDTGFRATLLGDVDVPVIRPVYANARARVGSSYAEIDLLAGFVFSSSYGAGDHTTFSMSNTYNSPTAYGYSYTQTTTAHTSYVVQRNAWIVLGGVKAMRRPLVTDGPAVFDKFKTYELGLANHYANSEGQHSRIEAMLVTRDGHFGASVKWFNAIVGMEVGWIPVLGGTNADGTEWTGSMFYWNFIDLGRYFDL